MQSVGHLESKVFLTQFSAPNVPPRRVYRSTAKCILVIPSGLTCAVHILQHTLRKMAMEKVIKGPHIVVSDAIEFKDLASNVIVTGNERNNGMPALSERMVRMDTGYR